MDHQAHLLKHKAFWLQEFLDEPPLLNLPVDYARTLQKDQVYASFSFKLGSADKNLMQTIVKQEGISSFTLFLSIYSILLSKLCNQEDIVIGLPINYRYPKNEKHNTIENTLVFRSHLSYTQSLKDFLTEVDRRAEACFEHKDYLYEELLNALQIDKGSGHSLFNVFFEYNSEKEKRASARMQETQSNRRFNPVSDLGLVINEGTNELSFDIIYCNTLFKERTVERFATYFKRIIHNVVTDNNICISEIDLLNDDERDEILNVFNHVENVSRGNKTVTDIFREQVNRTPENTALVFEGQVLNYRQLDEKSNQVARYLKSKGVQNGMPVPVFVERSADLIIVILGILKAGGAYVPIDPKYPSERINYMLDDIGALFMITSSKEKQKITGLKGIRVVCINEVKDEINSFSRELFHIPVSDSSLAYIMYTSGSTGVPKGVMISHSNIVSLVSGLICMEFKPNDILLSTGSPSFDASTLEYWGVLLNGSSLVLVADEVLLNIEMLKHSISSNKVTKMWFTSSWFNQLIDEDSSIFSSLDTVVIGGDKLSPFHIGKLRAGFPDLKIINGYGPTENTTFSLMYQIGEVDSQKDLPVGRPLYNRQAYVVDRTGHLCPVGIPGELWVGGDGLSSGYWKRPELTREKFIPDQITQNNGRFLYRTGDLTRWLPDGNIEYLGRIDEQIKIRGFRVEPGEIEHVLMESGLLKACVIVAKKDTAGNNYLIGYVVSKEKDCIERIQFYLKALLPHYMIPQAIVEMEKIPLTANGKVNKKLLPEPEYEIGTDMVFASTEVERRLLRLWADVLKVEESVIGVHSNFFKLGGHSLKAMLLINKIRKLFGVPVSLKQLFSEPTISGLSKLVICSEQSVHVPIAAAVVKDHYVLSSAQRRMYFLYEYNKLSVAYNIPQVIHMRGHLDKEKLRSSLDSLLLRHEALRTGFVLVGDEVFQRVHAHADLVIEEYISDSAASSGRIIGDFIRPFDLSSASLFRAGLICLNEQEHLLLIDMHHIIMDGMSVNILLNDFMSFYRGVVPASQRLQYKDYAEWQHSEGEQLRVLAQKSFWLSSFSDLPSVLNLPTDYVRPLERSESGDSYIFRFDREQSSGLRLVAEREGVSMFMLLLGIYHVLLSKLSNQEDIVIGTPVAGRDHADVEDIVGMFVNTLSLRNRLSSSEDFRTFLSSVRSNVLSCFENQGYQYEDLLDSLHLERDISRNPLFDVMFSYLNQEQSDLELPGLELSAYDTGRVVAKFDLMLTVQESGEELVFDFTYSTSLFRGETIARFAGYFKRIAASVVSDMSLAVSGIHILDKEERLLLSETFNASGAVFSGASGIMELFDRQAMLTPGRTALRYEGLTMSYGELQELSDKIAFYLQSRCGVLRGDFVGLMLAPDLYLLAFIYGILKSGAAYIPLDVQYPAGRVAAIALDSGMKLLIQRGVQDGDLLGSTAVADAGAVLAELELCEEVNFRSETGLSDLAYVIYTSGSTGKPKGVMIEHGSLLNIIEGMQRVYPVSSSDCFLFKTTYTFDVSVAEIFGWFMDGGSLSILNSGDKSDMQRLISLIEQHHVTHINFVPSLFSVFLDTLREYGTNGIASLKYILFCGEALPVQLVRDFHELGTGIRLENIYGPTEATVYSTAYSLPDRAGGGPVPIGKPLSNTRVYILDSYCNLQPLGVPGELCIGGTGLARGYLNNAEQTLLKFIPNPFEPGERLYRTGDLARWLPDGNIEYLGRMDYQVKIRGFRIELGEIEHHLNSYAGIKESVVLARGEAGNKHLVAYVVSSVELDESGLQAYLRGYLPDYMVPGIYVRLETMPLTASGKLNRGLLPEPAVVAGQDHVAPSTEVERRLLRLWADVLKVEESVIGVHSNFFEMGGHSISATKLLHNVQRSFKAYDFSLSDIFKNPSISAIANKLKQKWIGTGNPMDTSLIRLNNCEDPKGNLFFIHDGSGDIQGYNELVTLLPDYNCWGLRWPDFERLSPCQITMADISARYIENIKLVQPEGSYRIIGWSYGGIIAYDMLLELEKKGKDAHSVVMIDTVTGKNQMLENTETEPEFSLESEKELIVECMGEEELGVEGIASVEDLWQSVKLAIDKNPGLRENIRQYLPDNILQLVPNFDALSSEEMISSLNTVRTLRHLVSKYKMQGSLNAKLHYVKAANTEFNHSMLSDFFDNNIVLSILPGDHFSILKFPVVKDISKIIASV